MFFKGVNFVRVTFGSVVEAPVEFHAGLHGVGAVLRPRVGVDRRVPLVGEEEPELFPECPSHIGRCRVVAAIAVHLELD